MATKRIGCGVEIPTFSPGGRRWDKKCGQMYAGEMALCTVCLELAIKRYPQGWRGYPGDVCEHGTYVGGSGVDHMCGYCEAGVSQASLDADKRLAEREEQARLEKLHGFWFEDGRLIFVHPMWHWNDAKLMADATARAPRTQEAGTISYKRYKKIEKIAHNQDIKLWISSRPWQDHNSDAWQTAEMTFWSWDQVVQFLQVVSRGTDHVEVQNQLYAGIDDGPWAHIMFVQDQLKDDEGFFQPMAVFEADKPGSDDNEIIEWHGYADEGIQQFVSILRKYTEDGQTDQQRDEDNQNYNRIIGDSLRGVQR